MFCVRFLYCSATLVCLSLIDGPYRILMLARVFKHSDFRDIFTESYLVSSDHRDPVHYITKENVSLTLVVLLYDVKLMTRKTQLYPKCVPVNEASQLCVQRLSSEGGI